MPAREQTVAVSRMEAAFRQTARLTLTRQHQDFIASWSNETEKKWKRKRDVNKNKNRKINDKKLEGVMLQLASWVVVLAKLLVVVWLHYYNKI